MMEGLVTRSLLPILTLYSWRDRDKSGDDMRPV